MNDKPLDSQHSGSFFAEALHAAKDFTFKLALRDPVISKRYSEIEAHENAKQFAVNKARALLMQREADQLILEKLTLEIGGFETLDFANSLFRSFVSTGKPVIAIARELAGHALLAAHSVKILELATAAARESKLAHERFLSANGKLLAEVERQYADAKAERDAAFAAEQAEAAARDAQREAEQRERDQAYAHQR